MKMLSTKDIGFCIVADLRNYRFRNKDILDISVRCQWAGVPNDEPHRYAVYTCVKRVYH